MIERLLRAVKERRSHAQAKRRGRCGAVDSRPVVMVDTHADVEALIEALIEATAELIYLRQFGKERRGLVASDLKDAWRDKARNALRVSRDQSHPR